MLIYTYTAYVSDSRRMYNHLHVQAPIIILQSYMRRHTSFFLPNVIFISPPLFYHFFFMSSVIFISPHPSITSFFMSSDIFISPPPFYHSFFLSFLSCFVCLLCSIPRTCYTRKKVGTNIVFTGLSLMRRTMREWAESHFFSQHFFSPPARYRECKRNVIYGQKPIHHSHYFDMIFFIFITLSLSLLSPFEER